MNLGKQLWHHYQAAIRLSCKCAQGAFDLGIVVNWGRDHFYRISGGGCLSVTQERSRIGGCLRIVQECDPPDLGRQLLEQLQPFAAQWRLDRNEPGTAGSEDALAPSGSYAGDWVTRSIRRRG